MTAKKIRKSATKPEDNSVSILRIIRRQFKRLFEKAVT